MSLPEGPKLVVAALIQDEQKRVLLSQRRQDQPMPLYWELPGGKIEPGESPTEALEREIAEELGAEIQVGPIWDVLYHRYPTFDLLMLVYQAQLAPGSTPRAVDVKAIAFVSPEDLSGYEVLPADAPLIKGLRTTPG